MKTSVVRIAKSAAMAAGFLALMAGMSGMAMATLHPTPEMDPGSMANALLVLSSGLLIVTGRRRGK